MVPLRETCAGLPVHCKVKGLCKGERAAAMRPFITLYTCLAFVRDSTVGRINSATNLSECVSTTEAAVQSASASKRTPL